MVKILFSVSNSVYGIMSFKVLYDVILDSLLDSIFNLNYEMDVFEIIRICFYDIIWNNGKLSIIVNRERGWAAYFVLFSYNHVKL